MKLIQKDIEQIESLGVDPKDIERQYGLLCNGTVYPELSTAAAENNGIVVLKQDEEESFIRIFDEQSKKYKTGRFIPASGAATRMFAFLEEWLHHGKESEEVSRFFNEIKKFPFYSILEERNISDKKEVINFLLSGSGLNFNQLPKGLIPFHLKNQITITAVESHLKESGQYVVNANGIAITHFTISDSNETDFKNTVDAFILNNEAGHQVGFSFQSAKTDTIAIDENKNILRNESGKIIFRPGGHGSLLSNLNNLDEDIIFIRNIDNVVAPWNNDEYVSVHKMMGGFLIDLLEKLFRIQKRSDNDEKVTGEDIDFLKKYFYFDETANLKEFVFRPLRVCGMVKNEGEPGGGPFWVKNDGKETLQIIEASQVDTSDETQLAIFKSATHFNPVDICCCIKNYKGDKYDLRVFSNEKWSFVSQKNIDGNKARILEHPGLWNGSMYNWLTVFIEIPVSVFNPVKTVNDLLRPAHQK